MVLGVINNSFSQSLLAFSFPISHCTKGARKVYIKVQLWHFCAIQEFLCMIWKVKMASQSLWDSWDYVEGKNSKSLILLHIGG